MHMPHLCFVLAEKTSARSRGLALRERGSRCCDLAATRGIDAALFERLGADFAMLAHPVRLQILSILVSRGGEVCVCDLESALPVKQSTLSRHLRLLREAGWVPNPALAH